MILVSREVTEYQRKRQESTNRCVSHMQKVPGTLFLWCWTCDKQNTIEKQDFLLQLWIVELFSSGIQSENILHCSYRISFVNRISYCNFLVRLGWNHLPHNHDQSHLVRKTPALESLSTRNCKFLNLECITVSLYPRQTDGDPVRPPSFSCFTAKPNCKPNSWSSMKTRTKERY